MARKKQEKPVLDDKSLDLEKIKAALANDAGPLTLTLAVNRVTGRLTVTAGRVEGYDEMRILLAALQNIVQQLNADLVAMAEKKGREAALAEKTVSP